MTVNLTSDHEQLIAEDQWLEENRTTIDAKIDHALAQFERGECFYAEESRRNMESRKASWLSTRAG
jgi:hypothetical protein